MNNTRGANSTQQLLHTTPHVHRTINPCRNCPWCKPTFQGAPRSGSKSIKVLTFLLRRLNRGGVFIRKREILVNKWPLSMLRICSANSRYAAAPRPTRVHWLGATAYSRTQVRSDCGAAMPSVMDLQARQQLRSARLLHSGACVRQVGAKGVRRAVDEK